MLQLSRKKNQKIILDLRQLLLDTEHINEFCIVNKINPETRKIIMGLVDAIAPKTEFVTITMCTVDDTPGYALIGIDAPKDVIIQREEILDAATADRIQQTKKRRPLLSTSYKPGISSP